MKRFEFNIIPSVLNTFFPTYRVKSKQQIITILLEAVRYSLSYDMIKSKKSNGKIVLIVDKMSRLFFQNETKCYSISFPFLVTDSEGKIQYSYDNTTIDSYLISNLLSAITNDSFMDGCSIDFSESLIDFESESESFWNILRELLLFEEGYVRYDYDVIGYQEAKERGNEHIHPLNHCDFNYSNKANFKLGLINKIDLDEFIDILNIRTECKYLKNWR